jgi:hypothetical protein
MTRPGRYPQGLSTGAVDNATHRRRCLTTCSYISLYLKQSFTYLNNKLKINKKTVNAFQVLKNGIVMSIILTAITPTANAYDPNTELYKLYTHMKLGDDKQYRCVVILWRLESQWNPKAANKQSSARGIPQLLKMTETNPYKQIDLGLKYLAHRFNGDGCKALAYHKKHGHY